MLSGLNCRGILIIYQFLTTQNLKLLLKNAKVIRANFHRKNF